MTKKGARVGGTTPSLPFSSHFLTPIFCSMRLAIALTLLTFSVILVLGFAVLFIFSQFGGVFSRREKLY